MIVVVCVRSLCVCVWGGGVRVWVCVCMCVSVRGVGLEGFVFCCDNLYDTFSFGHFLNRVRLFIISFDVALLSFFFYIVFLAPFNY